MNRLVVVPSTLALLSSYSSIEDPISELRRAVRDAVAWLVQDGPAQVLGRTPAATRIGAELLGDRRSENGPGKLVVANGSATRTEKAPGHFDDRAEAFDAAIGTALAGGDPAALRAIDLDLAEALWVPDAPVLVGLAGLAPPLSTKVDFDGAPYGVQYWVVRWECAS